MSVGGGRDSVGTKLKCMEIRPSTTESHLYSIQPQVLQISEHLPESTLALLQTYLQRYPQAKVRLWGAKFGGNVDFITRLNVVRHLAVEVTDLVSCQFLESLTELQSLTIDTTSIRRFNTSLFLRLKSLSVLNIAGLSDSIDFAASLPLRELRLLMCKTSLRPLREHPTLTGVWLTCCKLKDVCATTTVSGLRVLSINRVKEASDTLLQDLVANEVHVNTLELVATNAITSFEHLHGMLTLRNLHLESVKARVPLTGLPPSVRVLMLVNLAIDFDSSAVVDTLRHLQRAFIVNCKGLSKDLIVEISNRFEGMQLFYNGIQMNGSRRETDFWEMLIP